METQLAGKIKKVHGLKGEVAIELFADIKTDELSFLLLAEKNAQPIPFFISTLHESGDHLLVKFENVNTPGEAKAIVNRDVFVPAHLISEDEKEEAFEELIGFSVTDKNQGAVGTIESILQLPGQIIFSVKHPSGKEILFPAIEEFISHIDDEKKMLYYTAPEGLIDVYLNPGKPEPED